MYELMAGGRRVAGAKAAELSTIPAIIRQHRHGELVTSMEEVLIDDIVIGVRFRQDYGDMEDFVESIIEKGIIQPITIRYQQQCQYSYGNDPNELDLREIELFENVFRKELEWHEKIKAVDEIQRIWTNKNVDTPWKWSIRKCAKMLGVSKSNLGRQLDLAKAVDKIPGLKDCKDEAEARKKINKLHERLAVNIAIKEQEEEIEKYDKDFLRIADANYRILDAFEGMDEIIELKRSGGDGGVFSFIEVDPPYGIDLQTQKRRVSNDDHDIKEYNEIDRSDYKKFLDGVCSRTYEIAADDSFIVFWFGPSWFTEVKIALCKAGWVLDPIPAIWSKGHGQTKSPNIYLARTYEPFFIGRKGSPSLASPGKSNVFTYSPVPPSVKHHPTERPLALMEDILSTFAHQGSSMLIPFLGSGVTLRACYNQNMLGTGWDLSQEYKKRFLLKVGEDHDKD